MIAWKTIPKYRYLVNGILVDLTADQAHNLIRQGLSVVSSKATVPSLYYTDEAKQLAMQAIQALTD